MTSICKKSVDVGRLRMCPERVGTKATQERAMRARVETVIRDEAGNILSQPAPREIDLKNQSLHDIEGAVENWKQQALPEIEATLLTEARASVYPEVLNVKKNT